METYLLGILDCTNSIILASDFLWVCSILRFFWKSPSSEPMVLRQSRAVLRSRLFVAISESSWILEMTRCLLMCIVLVYCSMNIFLYSLAALIMWGLLLRYLVVSDFLLDSDFEWKCWSNFFIDCSNAECGGVPQAMSVASRLLFGESDFI